MYNVFQKTVRATLFIALATMATTPAVAWTGPTAAPPGGTVPATPINTSATAQTKSGSFTSNAQILANVPSGYAAWSVEGTVGQYGGYFNGTAWGVQGFGGSNEGIYGQSTSNIGVHGINSSNNSWGGYFTGGYGVYSANSAGYYSQLDNGSWGLLTNGYIQAGGVDADVIH